MEQAKDRNGKTEQEFLRDYDVTKYFRPSVTVDAVLYTKKGNKLRILFVKRGGHPFIGMYAFPGGFVEQDEPCETAAVRELTEETSVNVPLRQLVTVSTPDRDPRWRNITVVFVGALEHEIEAHAGDDADDTAWFDIECGRDGTLRFSGDGRDFTVRLKVARDAFGDVDINNTEIVERGEIAFDHAKIVYYLFDKINR